MTYLKEIHCIKKYVMASFTEILLIRVALLKLFHVDSAVPEPLPEWIIRANVNYIVEDYTIQNGATICLPILTAHLFLKKPNAQEIDKYKDQFVDLVRPAGSVVIWHGHLWHCSLKIEVINLELACWVVIQPLIY